MQIDNTGRAARVLNRPGLGKIIEKNMKQIQLDHVRQLRGADPQLGSRMEAVLTLTLIELF